MKLPSIDRRRVTMSTETETHSSETCTTDDRTRQVLTPCMKHSCAPWARQTCDQRPSSTWRSPFSVQLQHHKHDTRQTSLPQWFTAVTLPPHGQNWTCTTPFASTHYFQYRDENTLLPTSKPNWTYIIIIYLLIMRNIKTRKTNQLNRAQLQRLRNTLTAARNRL